MARIVIIDEQGRQREIPLHKERLTIGRAPHNDLVVDHPAASCEHAVVVMMQSDHVLEDLGSTNGTKVNGQPVKKHFLQDGDAIELGKCTITYSARPPSHQAFRNSSFESTSARIKVQSGVYAGEETILTKPLMTIGRPGNQVAVIARSPQGFSLIHVEGAGYPLVNGESIGTTVRLLAHQDEIEVAGVRLVFLSSP